MQGDLKELFDLKLFNEQRLGEMEFILNSPAYANTFRPYLVGVIQGMNMLWKDRSKERKDRYPDDFLGGGSIVAEGLLEFFDRIVEETKMERVHNAMANMTPDQLYERKRQQGEMKPVLGLDQPALPALADPEEF